MYAIQTKCLGLTNARDTRVKATTMDKRPTTGRPDSVTINWSYNANTTENHLAAIRALIEKLGVYGKWCYAASSSGLVAVRIQVLDSQTIEIASGYNV